MPAVNDNVWSAQDTTPAAIEAALRELLIERHAENDGYVPARVLNLVCIVERQWSGEVANRLRQVGRDHASRTIVCAVSPRRTTIDAVATVAADSEPTPGVPALTHETIVIDVGPAHIKSLDTIVGPLVVTDLPTLVWTPHGFWDAVDALAEISQIVLLDSVAEPEVDVALRRAASLLDSHHVVDLAWLRSTPWRERLATCFDPLTRRAALRTATGVEVRHHPESGAAALLLCGWLAARLDWDVSPLSIDRERRAEGRMGSVDVRLCAVDLTVPGLDSVTLRLGDSSTLSLGRGPGGLRATSRDETGAERTWALLGASRGEGGILGEGIRQSLGRDQIYRQALTAAEGMLA